MSFPRPPHTRRLTAASIRLAAASPRRRFVAFALGVVVLGAGATAAAGWFETQLSPARRVAALEQENARLREAGNDARMALETERATRGELERQVSELNRQVLDLNTQLDFFRAQNRR